MKTKVQIRFAVTVKLISTLVFRYTDNTIPLLPKFLASSHLLSLYSLVCVEPHCWFSDVAAHFMFPASGCDYQGSIVSHPDENVCADRVRV